MRFCYVKFHKTESSSLASADLQRKGVIYLNCCFGCSHNPPVTWSHMKTHKFDVFPPIFPTISGQFWTDTQRIREGSRRASKTNYLQYVYPYGKSTFQIHFFAILISDSDSSWKSVYTNWSYFFKILTGTLSKIEKTVKNWGKFKKVGEMAVFLNFDHVPVGILKK